MFPSKGSSENVVSVPTYDFESLDQNTQQQLLDIIGQDTFTRFVHLASKDRRIFNMKEYSVTISTTLLPCFPLADQSQKTEKFCGRSDIISITNQKLWRKFFWLLMIGTMRQHLKFIPCYIPGHQWNLCKLCNCFFPGKN